MSEMPPDYPVLEDQILDPTLLQMLAPLPGPDPCGSSVRGESLFTEIRLAREEDDPALPMRQWERPLKKADWPMIESLCRDTLSTRSKDLQLAAWLTEAWTRQASGVAGLARGLLLLKELVTRYWDGLYPRMDPPEEGGGCEARVAPLDWLGESLAHTLRVHVAMLPLTDLELTSVSLADWERLTRRELSDKPGGKTAADAKQNLVLSREEIVANVVRYRPEEVTVRLAQVNEARTHLASLLEFLRRHLGPEASNLRKLDAALQALERVLSQVQSSVPSSEGAAAGASAPDVEEDPMPAAESVTAHPQDAGHPAQSSSALQTPSPISTGGWTNRDDAYRTLEALATYLSAIEPHSPTPYLIRRAVNWGRLPLPELMAEIMREEGDLNRMVHLLGLRHP